MNFLKHPDLHLLRWNTDFINYLNSKPPAVQYMKEEKITRGGIYGFPKFTNTEVVVKFWVADEEIRFEIVKCWTCKQAMAWELNKRNKHHLKCITCRKEASKVSSRKTSKTYRKKHASKTRLEIPCKQCNQLFNPFRSTRLYCSNKCRQRSFRAK